MVIRLTYLPCQIVYIVQGARGCRQVLRPLRSLKHWPDLLRMTTLLMLGNCVNVLEISDRIRTSSKMPPDMERRQNRTVAVPDSIVVPLLLSMMRTAGPPQSDGPC